MNAIDMNGPFPLRSGRDYDAAVAALDTLAVRPEGSLDVGERDSFDTLTMLVEAYDREHQAVDDEKRDPLAMLKYLIQKPLSFAGPGRENACAAMRP